MSKHQIQPGCVENENERADAGREGAELVSRDQISGASGDDSEISISPVLQLTTSRIIGNYTD